MPINEIYINGDDVGYQFNKYSNGVRRCTGPVVWDKECHVFLFSYRGVKFEVRREPKSKIDIWQGWTAIKIHPGWSDRHKCRVEYIRH